MAFTNATTFAAIDVPIMDATGRDVVVAIVKATFEVDPTGKVHLADEPSEVRLGDVPHDPDDPRSSLRYASDVCPEKRGADVVVVGEAVSPRPVQVMDVAVQVGGVIAPLRVHGERVFYRGVGGVRIGPAAPFERKAIVYEKAYGGMADDLGTVEEQNPSGLGVARSAAELVDRPAPQIEHPERPHRSASDRHPPAGYGAVASHWSPRKDHAGTFDAAWKESRMPLMPVDFDARYYNVAHPSLQLEQPLAPGAEVSLLGMVLSGLLRFRLPAFPIVIVGVFDDGRRLPLRPPIDTLLIEPSRRRFELVTRAALPLGRGRTQLRELRVDTDDG